MVYDIRTDLAKEAVEVWEQGEQAEKLRGVEISSGQVGGLQREVIDILSDEGERSLGKTRGRYVTWSLDVMDRREEEAFTRSVEALAGELRSLLELKEDEGVLVAALGNADIMPDALGTLAAESVFFCSLDTQGRMMIQDRAGNVTQFQAIDPGEVKW